MMPSWRRQLLMFKTVSSEEEIKTAVCSVRFRWSLIQSRLSKAERATATVERVIGIIIPCSVPRPSVPALPRILQRFTSV